MQRTRYGRGPPDRKSFNEMLRIVRLRNVRMNYELNHEWEQLCREIWVRVAEIAFFDRSFAARLHADEVERDICAALARK